MGQIKLDSARETQTPVIEINFRQLWNCCWGREEYVIVMIDDDGKDSRHAVCKGCAMQYSGEVELLPTEYNTVEGMPRYPVRPFSLDWDYVKVPNTQESTGPDDLLWEGDCHLACKALIPGSYEGTDKWGHAVTLNVMNPTRSYLIRD